MFPSVCQDMHARVSALSFATERSGPGARGQFYAIDQELGGARCFSSVVHATTLHGEVLISSTSTLRFFNLFLSGVVRARNKVQCGAWLVERRFSDKPRVVIRHLGLSCASLLVPVERRSPRLRPPSQVMIAHMLCHALPCPDINSPEQQSRQKLGRNTIPC